MFTRRNFLAGAGAAVAAARLMPEMAWAQRAAIRTANLPKDMVWLNANENPAGIPEVSQAAMREVIPTAYRYHYQEVGDIDAAIAKSDGLAADQILVGAGSSEPLHIVVDAFTSATRPFITVTPAYEGPVEVARALGRPIVLTKLREDYTADVHKLAEEADKAHGGLIYLCNPNNPTSTVTRAKDLAWLVANLPPNTTLLMDEAYFHFVEEPDVESALEYVRQGKDVIVARTYSKIYGMAGLRVGYVAARPDTIERIHPLRMNIISIVSARAVVAALGRQKSILSDRRASLAKTRRELCGWLKDQNVKFIEPHANFLMIDCQRNAREFIAKMPPLGVAPGRPFPPLDNLLRVTIGTDQEMAKFRDVFWKVYKG
jgi:histidinol-phosphate aminotransferase